MKRVKRRKNDPVRAYNRRLDCMALNRSLKQAEQQAEPKRDPLESELLKTNQEWENLRLYGSRKA
jgi:hypothetical protein